eukprot:6286066-Alexandrium_andersonii.AAC.1
MASPENQREKPSRPRVCMMWPVLGRAQNSVSPSPGRHGGSRRDWGSPDIKLSLPSPGGHGGSRRD